MKLHLPKVLLSAVIAATACYQQVQGAVEGTVETYTVTGNNDRAITEYTAEDTITFNKENGHLYMAPQGQPKEITIAAKTVITNLKLTDGAGNTTYYFTNTVSGTGEFSFTATTTCTNQQYKFTGDMSNYSGAMKLVKDDRASAFIFEGNKSGTGTIEVTGTNRVDVIGATMQNSSITASILNASGTSSFAGDVTAGTLTVTGEDATLTIAAGKTLTIDSLVATSGKLVFESGAQFVYNGRFNAAGGLVDNKVYGFKEDKTVDIFEGDFGMDEARLVIIDGNTYTVDAGGVIRDYDNYYYISGNVNASVVNADLLTSGSHAGFELNGGTLTMDEDFTITGSSMLTGTIVDGASKLIVSNGSTLQVNNDDGKILKSNIHIVSGGTMVFLGTGRDAIDYGQTGRTIYVDGTMDFGTTRQTVGNWTFEMTGGTIQGTGAMNNNNIVAMDFHGGVKGYINANALAGATAEAPTVSTINAPVRMGGAVDFDVEGNARLDMLGVLIGNNKLTKTGDGVLRLQNNGNTYNAIDVTDGTLEVRDNAVTMNSAVTVSGGAQMQILQNETCANTLANVTINNGSLLVQNTVHHNNNNTTITNLTVAEGGATIGMVVNSTFNSTNNAKKITIGTLAGSGDLVVCGDGSQTSTIYVNGGTDFSGNVQVISAAGKRTDLDLASNTALADSVVVLGGGSGETTGSTTYFVLGSADTAVKGIQDAEGRKSGGGVIIRTSQTPSTLTIDTGDDNYSTKSGVGKYINLVKKGSGTQSFGNEVSNTNSGEFSGSIDVQGGTLAFTKEGATTTVSSLTLSGGSLDVTGSLTLNALSVDFSKYSTDKTHTLVSSGGLTLNGVDLQAITGVNGDYIANVEQVNESLVLFYLPATVTTEVESYTLDATGTALTLNVKEAVLREGMQVNVHLITDAMMRDILQEMQAKGAIKDGSNPIVSITLAGSESGLITADKLNEVVFVKGETGLNYWGEMVGSDGGEKVLMYNVNRIPEPTTATLSLLALMGLAARRRRK